VKNEWFVTRSASLTVANRSQFAAKLRFPLDRNSSVGSALQQQVVGRGSETRMFYDYQAYYISHGCLSIMAALRPRERARVSPADKKNDAFELCVSRNPLLPSPEWFNIAQLIRSAGSSGFFIQARASIKKTEQKLQIEFFNILSAILHENRTSTCFP
jgi:hypothetical protein